MKHVLSALVNNTPGVTSRVSGLFRRRGYNIDSFIGSSTEDERFSRLTIVVQGDDIVIAQVLSQLEKLEDIISIEDIRPESMISKVLLFIKVKAEVADRLSIIVVANACNARVIEMSKDYLILEALDTEDRISDMIEVFKPYGIIELVKTGVVAMKR
ncbi:MAG: acetolactate synthase small subunit [Eubacteriales bacterium]|nr:acetolactate synthase small subunit [Eubacteriales bacterium]MDD3200188.1 acetolactate synthase small subunit [Eubacteriales bacterium]MDD4121643.1 acetolactate synthase small subunit [Eubacteriales bacterium]MDD4630289.1 acetolactate synthase small subunit [Eubacteriales bacterium]